MEHRVYRPDQRPDVEVLVDGVWHAGELRMWTQAADGAWLGNVQWRPAGESTRRLDTFAAADVRAVQPPTLRIGARTKSPRRAAVSPSPD